MTQTLHPKAYKMATLLETVATKNDAGEYPTSWVVVYAHGRIAVRTRAADYQRLIDLRDLGMIRDTSTTLSRHAWQITDAGRAELSRWTA